MKWREVLSCRGIYGSLSDKNNPEFSEGLFAFPAGSTTMERTPYVEVGVGIENILKSASGGLCVAFNVPEFTEY